MKMQELINKTEKEIFSLLNENQNKLKSLQVLHAAGKVKNIHEMSMLRKDIARIKTILAKKDQ